MKRFLLILLLSRTFYLTAQSANYYFDKGAYYLRAHQDSICIFYLTRAIELDSLKSDYYIDRAVAFIELKRFRLAISDLRMAENIDSNNSLIYYNLACIYSLEKDAKNGLSCLEKAFSKGFGKELGEANYMRIDDDLKFLRAEEKFGELIKKYRIPYFFK